MEHANVLPATRPSRQAPRQLGLEATRRAALQPGHSGTWADCLIAGRAGARAGQAIWPAGPGLDTTGSFDKQSLLELGAGAGVLPELSRAEPGSATPDVQPSRYSRI